MEPKPSLMTNGRYIMTSRATIGGKRFIELIELGSYRAGMVYKVSWAALGLPGLACSDSG